MPRVEIRGLSKAFGGVRALREVSLDIEAGEIHALCGENGAGKSTLNKILSGSVVPDAGTVLLDCHDLPHGSVHAAEAAGVAIVHQESASFPQLDACDNVFAGHEPRTLGGLGLDVAKMRRDTQDLLARLGETFSVRTPLGELSSAQRQMVAIARALSKPCRLLILDEPTASLSARETDTLFSIVRELRTQGVAVLYVSHRLEEVFALADRVTVLRDGQVVGTAPVDRLDRGRLIHMMVGREVEETHGGGGKPGDVMLQVEGLARQGAFREVSFDVRAGEVVALAGLVGAGRSEVAKALFGIEPADAGVVRVAGQQVDLGSPQRAMGIGLSLVPEDRQHEGLALPMKLCENLVMAAMPDVTQSGLISGKKEALLAGRLISDLGIRAESAAAPTDSLSGGNQQKVLLGKWLARAPRVLILDEPTRGVDVGAKAEVHRLIRELASQNVAILMVSSDLPEVLALADRVVVMREGIISGTLNREEIDQSRILSLSLPSADQGHSEGREEPVRTFGGVRRLLHQREFGVAALLALTLLAVSIVNPAFRQIDSIWDLLVRLAPTVVVACGMTLVILTREIDISVGSLTGLTAALIGIVASPDRMGGPVWLAIVVALVVGLGVGLLNGVLVALGKVPSIIVTLGMLTALRGVTEMLMGGKWIENLPPGLRVFGIGRWLGLPVGVWFAIAAVAATTLLLTRTALGRRIYALGDSAKSASLAGISPTRVRIFVFGLMGLLTAVATLLSATQLSTIESGIGGGFELVVVTCVVVGGTSIQGGRGSILGSVLGVLLLGTVGTMLIFLRLGPMSTYWEKAIQGAFILAAVLADHLSRTRSRRRA